MGMDDYPKIIKETAMIRPDAPEEMIQQTKIIMMEEIARKLVEEELEKIEKFTELGWVGYKIELCYAPHDVFWSYVRYRAKEYAQAGKGQ